MLCKLDTVTKRWLNHERNSSNSVGSSNGSFASRHDRVAREDLVLENLSLRQQLLALHVQRPRHRLTALHKLFWVALRTCWAGWRKPLVLVTPRTVVNWHRAGFRLYWTWVSRVSQVGGRKRVSKEVRALIFRMLAENPTWGAPQE